MKILMKKSLSKNKPTLIAVGGRKFHKIAANLAKKHSALLERLKDA